MPQVQSGLVYGDKSQAVSDLQTALQQLGFSISTEESGSGFFNETCAAVSAFKKKYEITSSPCLVEKQTAEKLNQLLKEKGIELTVSFPLFFGMKSDAVAVLQEGLKAKGFASSDAGGDFSQSTCSAVTRFQAEFNIAVTPCYVDEAMANKMNELLTIPAGRTFTVSGKVLNTFNEPVAGKNVVAYDLDLAGVGYYKEINNANGKWFGAGMQPLGSATTGEDGSYEISFAENSFSEAEGEDWPDVVSFLIINGTVEGRSALSSKKDFSGGTMLSNWNIVISNPAIRSENEYAGLRKAVDPFMRESKLELYQIAGSEDQIRFVAADTGQDAFNVAQLVFAGTLTNDASEVFKANEIGDPVELLYGIGRQGILLSWASLAVAQKEAALLKAIQDATAGNIIKEYTSQAIDMFLTALGKAALQSVVKTDETRDNPVAKTLSFALGNDSALQTKYLSALNSYTGSAVDFWQKELPGQGFEPAAIKALQLTTRLSLLTYNHLPLMEELQVNKKISKPEELLNWSKADWNSILDKTGIPGQASYNDKDKNKYAEAIQAMLNTTFPNQKIATMIGNGGIAIADKALGKGVANFLNEQSDFNILNSSAVTPALKKALDAIHPQAFEKIKHLQRLAQVSPTPETMSVLYNENLLTSARDIAAIPRQNFIAAYSDKLGDKDMAEIVYERASYVTQRIDQLYITLNDLHNAVAPAYANMQGKEQGAIPAPDNAATNNMLARESGSGGGNDGDNTLKDYFPNWENLFGSISNCECEECRSITSPAAYLVDMLQFLKHIPSENDQKSALDALFYRRPDLGELPLTCENTNTTMPYIDLVNGIMEYYVANGSSDNYKGYDIGDTSTEELHANPQNTGKEAYRILSNNSGNAGKTAFYPFTLPYNQPLDRIRIYLEKLQTSRAELMEVFRVDGDKSVQKTTNAINAEFLHISQEEYVILTDTNNVHEYFGYTSDAEMLADAINAQVFIRCAGIDYTDLVEIIKTRFINPAQPAFQYLQQLFAATGMDAPDIYNALSAINKGNDVDITQALAGKIAYADFKQWTTRNFPGIQQLVTLYQSNEDIKDYGYDIKKTWLKTVQSLYETIDDNGITAAMLGRLHRFIRLWKKLGCTISELDTIITSLGETDITETLINNIALLRKVSNLLSFSLQQVACIWGKIDTNGKNALYNKLFLNKALKEIDGAFQPDALGNYFTGNTAIIKDHKPAIQAAMKVSEDELNTILSDSDFKEDALLSVESLSGMYRYTLLAGALRLSVSDFVALKHISGINPFPEWDVATNTFTQIDPQQTLLFIDNVQKIRNTGFTIPLLDYIINDRDEKAAIQLPVEKLLQTLSAIQAVVLQIAKDHPPSNIPDEELLRNNLNKNIVVEQLSMLVDAEEAATVMLLQDQSTAIADILGTATQEIKMEDPNVKALIAQIDALHKAALFVKGFGLTVTEIQYFIKNKTDFSGIDFSRLSFNHWNRVADYTLLRNDVATTPDVLIRLFEAASKQDATIDAIMKAGLLDDKIIPKLNARFGITDVKMFGNEVALTQLNKALKLLQKIGTSVDKIVADAPAVSWADTTADFDLLWSMAEDMKRTLKAKYEEEDWLQIAKAMSNTIRESQKQALIAWLLVQPKLKTWGVIDADSLFEYFLIDVQMDACMDTSPIVQANNGIQLFIARILLNLEANRVDDTGASLSVLPKNIDTAQWAWRKNYRVWQAAREVYLFPENWLDPEWRDDKSPIFKALESELLQNDITADSVDMAFRNYLSSLEKVSNVEICGMHQEDPSSPGSDIYVFARTHQLPYEYYWRKKTGDEWTAWENIPTVNVTNSDASGSGVHLLPVFWKKRLILFWAEFMQKTKENKAMKSNDTISNMANLRVNDLKSENYWEVRLAWTEYKDGKWTPKKVTKDEFITLYEPGLSKDFQFNAVTTDDGNLAIQTFFKDRGGKIFGTFQLTNINAKVKVTNQQVQKSSPFELTSDKVMQNRIPLFRWYNKQTGDHFYSTSTNEPAANLGYDQDTPFYVVVFATELPNTVPFYRLYNSQSGHHFYTTSDNEYQSAQSASGYTSEGIECYVFDKQQPNTVPLYRYRHIMSGYHFYTTSIIAGVFITSIFEGIACYVFDNWQSATNYAQLFPQPIPGSVI
ncbi:MAG: neuraminidase-like domain-containing protein [Agriterribacter sp.]